MKLVPCKDADASFGIPLLVLNTVTQLASITLLENDLATKRKTLTVKRLFPQTLPIAVTLTTLNVVVDAPARRYVRPTTWRKTC